jgi:hypothetical protein
MDSSLLAFILFFLILGAVQMAFNKFYPRAYIILILYCLFLTNNYNKRKNNKNNK